MRETLEDLARRAEEHGDMWRLDKAKKDANKLFKEEFIGHYPQQYASAVAYAYNMSRHGYDI